MPAEEPKSASAVERLIERFALTPHPDVGFFREVYRSPPTLRLPLVPTGVEAARAGSSLIYYLDRGEPVAIVPAGVWQAARPAAGAAFAFVGCTVAPGFDFADFEMPPRAELTARYPQHAAVIRSLTRA